jgi:hypothetical protein
MSLTVSWVVQSKFRTVIEARFAIEFAGMTNVTALMLIPLTEIAQGF